MNAALQAACLTPLAPAGIAVVRLRGPQATRLLPIVFRPHSSGASVPPSDRRLLFGRILDGEEVLDDAIVAVQHRVDGIEYVDFNTHGGPRIVQRLLMVLRKAGATVVATNEMTADAWPSEDLIEREALALLPQARSPRAAAWLLRQRDLWREAWKAVLALLPDQIEAATGKLTALLQTRDAARHMLHGIHIAIVGSPNAGKSTLANALCGKDRILVSDQPGTTRDYVIEWTTLEGVPVNLIDTAGIRSSDDPLEREAIRRAHRQAGQADLRLLVIDQAGDMTPELQQLLATLSPGDPTLLVLNKADLPSGVKSRDLPAAWANSVIRVSAATGQGMESLKRCILQTACINEDFDRRAAVFSEPLQNRVRTLLESLDHSPRLTVAEANLLLFPRENPV